MQHLQPGGGGRASQIDQRIKDDSIIGQTCRLAASPGKAGGEDVDGRFALGETETIQGQGAG